jgi:hypothetical protein
VINETAAAKDRSWMYLDTCQETADMRQQPRDDRYPSLVKPVSHAMKPNGMEARVGEQDFDAV